MKHSLQTFALIAVSSMALHASSFVVGMEDYPLVGDNDYNDIIASLAGTVEVHSDGVFTPLTSADQSGTPFWNHVSADGAFMNIGNYVLGTGGFSGGPIIPNPAYLADPSGSIVSFYFTGDATISIIGGITGGKDSLGVCPVVGCSAANTVWITSSTNYVSNGDWQLTGTNLWGNQWYSDFAGGQTSEFALFKDPPASDTPEPSTMALLGAGGIALGLFKRRKRA